MILSNDLVSFRFKEYYKEAMNGVIEHLVKKSVPNQLTYVGEMHGSEFSPKMVIMGFCSRFITLQSTVLLQLFMQLYVLYSMYLTIVLNCRLFSFINNFLSITSATFRRIIWFAFSLVI